MNSIVIDLQKEILNDSDNATLLLRKAHLIASKLGLEELDLWIMNELNGYAKYEDIPDYRNLRGECKAFNPYRGWIPVVSNAKLEEIICNYKIPDSISKIENLISTGENITVTYSSEIQYLLNKNSPSFFQCAMFVPNASVKAIINYVKNVLLDWTLKLEKEKILGYDMCFNDAEIEKAKEMPNTVNYYYGTTNVITNTINGNNNVINNNYINDIEDIKKSLATEKINDDNRQEALQRLETIKNEITNNKNSNIWIILLIELKNFLISIGASITANIIQNRFGIYSLKRSINV